MSPSDGYWVQNVTATRGWLLAQKMTCGFLKSALVPSEDKWREYGTTCFTSLTTLNICLVPAKIPQSCIWSSTDKASGGIYHSATLCISKFCSATLIYESNSQKHEIKLRYLDFFDQNQSANSTPWYITHQKHYDPPTVTIQLDLGAVIRLKYIIFLRKFSVKWMMGWALKRCHYFEQLEKGVWISVIF